MRIQKGTSLEFGHACAVCGRPTLGELCPACWAEDERAFRKVKGYLKERPMATVAEVSTATGVEERRIARWVAKGWLQLCCFCAVCGRPLKKGEVCPECTAGLAPEIKKPATEFSREHAPVRVMGVVRNVEGGMGRLKSALNLAEKKSQK
ncbi:hypothetical protein SAMN00808754_1536 [Thermanaeromonas toyohensis ToBE]|uniref:Flagellar operon protein TIGR03826 n=2 Tax=Thermanaeromonas TaxID=202949 RepID=A0A1W1VT96_9FIRM|nr:hypothetical protein SAMN00808754_1536 [Thermanaeromonas toyohensis ToBE]